MNGMNEYQTIHRTDKAKSAALSGHWIKHDQHDTALTTTLKNTARHLRREMILRQFMNIHQAKFLILLDMRYHGTRGWERRLPTLGFHHHLTSHHVISFYFTSPQFTSLLLFLLKTVPGFFFFFLIFLDRIPRSYFLSWESWSNFFLFQRFFFLHGSLFVCDIFAIDGRM